MVIHAQSQTVVAQPLWYLPHARTPPRDVLGISYLVREVECDNGERLQVLAVAQDDEELRLNLLEAFVVEYCEMC